MPLDRPIAPHDRSSCTPARARALPRLLSPLAIALVAFGCSSGGDDTPTGGDDATIDTGGELEGGPIDGGGDETPSDGGKLDGGSGDGGGVDSAPIDAGTPITPGDPGAADVKFVIRSDGAVHAISPLIYGTNGDRDLGKNHQTMLRSGGNRMTAYNWETNASNAGSDYCFQNDSFLSTSKTPGDAIKPMVEAAKASGATALVTIPIVDYVAADEAGGSGPPDCSGDIRKTGASYLTTRCKQNKPVKGAPFSTTPDVSDGFVYQDEFVSWLKGAVPGVKMLFAMDNEPDLWSGTHAEVHPTPVGYDELCKRNIDFAKATKAVWSDAKVTGFVSYGYAGYVNLQSAPDSAGKGDFVEYYLDKMKAAEAGAGRRLIDYLDLHWYSEAQGGGVRIVGADTGTKVVEARLQAPRSLWDPTYKEDSWIVNDVLKEPIRLIPRYLEKIAAHYPGTQLAFTEWNYGGGTDISGALAGADVLGIFGREGVGAASLWELNGDEHFTYAAFKAYRNYDGAGAAFGDTSIAASTSDVATATVYASLDSGKPARVVIVAINKADASKTAGITVAHPTSFKTASVWTVTAAAAQPVAAAPITAVATNAFHYTMPARSISVIVPAP